MALTASLSHHPPPRTGHVAAAKCVCRTKNRHPASARPRRTFSPLAQRISARGLCSWALRPLRLVLTIRLYREVPTLRITLGAYTSSRSFPSSNCPAFLRLGLRTMQQHRQFVLQPRLSISPQQHTRLEEGASAFCFRTPTAQHLPAAAAPSLRAGRAPCLLRREPPLCSLALRPLLLVLAIRVYREGPARRRTPFLHLPHHIVVRTRPQYHAFAFRSSDALHLHRQNDPAPFFRVFTPSLPGLAADTSLALRCVVPARLWRRCVLTLDLPIALRPSLRRRSSTQRCVRVCILSTIPVPVLRSSSFPSLALFRACKSDAALRVHHLHPPRPPIVPCPGLQKGPQRRTRSSSAQRCAASSLEGPASSPSAYILPVLPSPCAPTREQGRNAARACRSSRVLALCVYHPHRPAPALNARPPSSAFCLISIPPSAVRVLSFPGSRREGATRLRAGTARSSAKEEGMKRVRRKVAANRLRNENTGRKEARTSVETASIPVPSASPLSPA
ncbi:hypothetical protein C8R44DRAFT_987129 [Mycena epipterygia]|nr:hypothetical protein C8R44DRAFT_987129 [Mycena epipterygia]